MLSLKKIILFPLEFPGIAQMSLLICHFAIRKQHSSTYFFSFFFYPINTDNFEQNQIVKLTSLRVYVN